MFDLETLVLLLSILATAVMAASAATQAVRCEFDPVGAIFLSVITAVGGGTLRDILIGVAPVFWLNDPVYLFTAVPVGLAAFFLVRKMKVGTGRRLKLLAYLDAVGLALFTLVGVKVALANDLSATFAVILGCITGIGGGIFRDVLCGITPIVLKRDIYATLSLLGGGLYIVVQPFWGEQISVIVAFLAIAIARIVVVARTPAE